MAEIVFDPELMLHIKTIYGDRELTGLQLKQIHNTWKVNPDWIRNAALLRKQVKPVALTRSSLADMAGVTNPVNIRTLEIANDDLSGINDFNTAFGEARKRGLNQFKWRSTKGNPSGIFGTLLTLPNKPVDPLPEVVTTASDLPLDFPWTGYTKGNLFKPTGNPSLDQVNLSYINYMINRIEPSNVTNFFPWGRNKFQQGGTMNNQEELQKAFMAYLIQDAAAQGIQLQSEEDLQEYAQLLGEEGIQAKYQEFVQKMQGGTMARLGAKLEYYRKLKGVCPDGSQPTYFKNGGMFKKKCTACEKAQNGKKMNAVLKFKKDRTIEKTDTIHTKYGVRDLNNKTKFPKWNPKKENYSFEERMRVTEKDRDSNKKIFGSACGSKLKKKK